MVVEGIVLGAGYSSRAGSFKLALELEGKTVIERCVDGMYGVCDRITAVVGYRAGKLAPILDRYPKVTVVHNADYPKGMFTSVKKGLENARGDRSFIMPGDYPLVERKVYESMLEVDGDIVIPVYGGKTGHPLLLSKQAATLLLSSEKYSSLRDFIADRPYRTLEVNCPGILMDLDTQENFRAMKILLSNRS